MFSTTFDTTNFCVDDEKNCYSFASNFHSIYVSIHRLHQPVSCVCEEEVGKSIKLLETFVSIICTWCVISLVIIVIIDEESVKYLSCDGSELEYI